MVNDRTQMRATLVPVVMLVCSAACARQPPSDARTPAAGQPATAGQARATKQRGGPLIEFAGYRFDPRDGLPDVPSDLATVEPGLWIVQIHDSKDREVLAAELSLSLSTYIPSHAYRELLSDSQVEAVRRDPRVRGVVGYPAAFKLSADLRERDPADPDGELQPLLVLCHAGAVPSEILAALRALRVGTVTALSMPAGTPARFRIGDPVPGAARMLAGARGTVWIEPEPRIDMD